MDKIASFTVDHLLLEPGVYVSRVDADPATGATVTTFDLRLTAPNREPVMDTAAVHAIEHLAATYLRNDPAWKDDVVYFGPMGCRTGFYLILFGERTSAEVAPLVRSCFEFIRDFEGEIPGARPEECGNWHDADLNAAHWWARRYVERTLTAIDAAHLFYPGQVPAGEDGAAVAPSGENPVPAAGAVPIRVGIIGAMAVEVELLRAQLKDAQVTRVSGMEFCSGTLNGTSVVVVQSGIGKVNSGICMQVLADRFGVTHVINTGVAGSLDARLDIGDLVVSTDCVQHDFAVGPLGYAPGLIPGLDTLAFVANKDLVDAALAAAAEVAPEVTAVTGRVASGDQFIWADADKDRITQTFAASCCEMEGASIAQAAYLNGVPFVVVRAISDKPGTAEQAVDYATFERQSAHRCAKIVAAMVARL